MNQELFATKTALSSEFAKHALAVQRASDIFSPLHLPIKTFIDEQNKQAEMLKQAFQPLNDLQNALNLSHIRTFGNIATPIASLARLTENKAFPATPAPKRKLVIIDHEPISLSDTQQKEQQTNTPNQALAVSVTHLPPAETEPRKSRKQLQRENIALQAKLETQQTLIEMLVNAQQARPNEPLTKANQTIDDQQKQIETLQAEIDRLQALVLANANNDKELPTRTANNAGKIISALAVELLKMDITQPYGKSNKDIAHAIERQGDTLSEDTIAHWLKIAHQVSQ